MISSLLRGVGRILSVRAIASITNAEITSVRKMLAELEKAGIICVKMEHHVDGWTVPVRAESGVEDTHSQKWLEKLSEYVLSSPVATLPEIMTVLENGNPSPRDRAFLLLEAMRQAQKNGEFRLLSYFIREIMLPGGNILTAQEAGEILSVFEPRKLRNFDCDTAVEFIEQYLPLFNTTRERAMALTRMGELELLESRLQQAEEHFREALELSMEMNTGDWVPAILSSLAEIPRDFDGMKETAAVIDKVINWLPGLGDNDIMVRILATAAAALAELRMNAAAEKTILSAMIHIPVVTLKTQQILEWCRAKVFIASGRKKPAMDMLRRALLLAESVNDQLAVMEILSTIFSEMKESPDYTVRNLISIMQSVSKRAAISGNISNRLYALDHMVDMYTRTLQFSKAVDAAQKVSRIIDSSDMLEDEPLTAWCEAYLCFLGNDEKEIAGGDLILPGTDGFLKSLSGGFEPVAEAGIISEHLLASPGSDSTVYALILAMEAFARGFDKASSIIAAALDSSYSNFTEDPFVSWELCISGILASKARHADDFFQSAQILARQLDRLLLVWLMLRCRIRLNPDRNFREYAEISLLLAELEEHIAQQLPDNTRNVFMKRTGAGQRLEKLRISAGCPEGTLRDIRNSLARKLEDETMETLREISKISSRISSRSEISTSLETLGILARADRILALQVKGRKVSIIEVYGPGSSKLPGIEAEEKILKLPGEKVSVDNFGETPFGSRRYFIIPTKKSVIPSRRERKLHSLHSQRGNYLLIEIDSPFYNISETVEFFVESLCRQIGSALLLRDRESMAYIDTLTGSDIGYSWMKQLVTLKDNETSADTTLSVLLLDVDGLREINRLFGYRAGDNALKTVVSTVKGLLRPDDIIGRLSEDLFGVLLPETEGENTIKVAERICSVISGTEIRPDRVPVTVSVGASISSSRKENPELTVNRAYAALNQSKSQGGNRAIIWSAEEDVKEFDSETMMLFNTGDPGWDHSISITIMELLIEDSPSLEMLAEKLRDVLRSEFIYLEDVNGNSFRIGSSIFKRMPEEMNDNSTNRIRTYSGIMGRYDALSVGLTDGGRLISAWDNVDGISGSLKNVFRALASLTSLLIRRGSVISEHPPELRP